MRFLFRHNFWCFLQKYGFMMVSFFTSRISFLFSFFFLYFFSSSSSLSSVHSFLFIAWMPWGGATTEKKVHISLQYHNQSVKREARRNSATGHAFIILTYRKNSILSLYHLTEWRASPFILYSHDNSALSRKSTTFGTAICVKCIPFVWWQPMEKKKYITNWCIWLGIISWNNI